MWACQTRLRRLVDAEDIRVAGPRRLVRHARFTAIRDSAPPAGAAARLLLLLLLPPPPAPLDFFEKDDAEDDDVDEATEKAEVDVEGEDHATAAVFFCFVNALPGAAPPAFRFRNCRAEDDAGVEVLLPPAPPIAASCSSRRASIPLAESSLK